MTLYPSYPQAAAASSTDYAVEWVCNGRWDASTIYQNVQLVATATSRMVAVLSVLRSWSHLLMHVIMGRPVIDDEV
jgi:hypothetical protein